MLAPPRWTEEQFAEDSALAREVFRRERIQEPLARWIEAFDAHAGMFAELLDQYGASDPRALTPERVAQIFAAGLGAQLRYLAGPPISADDLIELADTSIAPSVLGGDLDAAGRVLEIILQTLDPRRFPWVEDARPATDLERHAAIVASAALMTTRRVQTDRANEGKEAQEAATKAVIEGLGFVRVAERPIANFHTAPNPGEFCGETLVGSRKADIVVRLRDGRLMPIECKVSNSSTNSVKRLNNDAAVKARIWLVEFGKNQIVPAAMLSGVFKTLNLVQAQDGDLTIFWAHDFGPLEAFIQGAV